MIDGGGQLDATFSTAAVSPSMAAAAVEPDTLARGTMVGRYVIVDRIGSGGMSVVYSAYDPELDRKIAVKRLRSELLSGGGQARALREAP